jgi:hypothetical protein
VVRAQSRSWNQVGVSAVALLAVVGPLVVAVGTSRADAVVDRAPALGGAKRPAPPAGYPVLSPGQLPRPCVAGDEKVMGYFYDVRTKAWVSAPFCYPVWGNLVASAPQVVDAGAEVTVVATPTDGSTSGTYAPQMGAITWTPSGTVKHGCGASDMTCSVVVAKEATGSWQWFQVAVSMPRTFFIGSMGGNCQFDVPCPGATTNAWAWIAVRPQAPSGCTVPGKGKVRLGGMVRKRVMTSGIYEYDVPTVGPAQGVSLTVAGGGRKCVTATDAAGAYAVYLPKGRYRVGPSHSTSVTEPRSRSLALTSATGGVDFTLCANPKDEQLGKKDCRLVLIEGTVTDINGATFPALGSPASGPPGISIVSLRHPDDGADKGDDAAVVNARGRFSIWATPDTTWLKVYASDACAQTIKVHASKDIKNLTLKVTPVLCVVKSDPALIYFQAGFLPPTPPDMPYLLDVVRFEPVVNDFCTYGVLGTPLVAPGGALSSASIQPVNGRPTFCRPGPYTATVVGVGGSVLATVTFP